VASRDFAQRLQNTSGIPPKRGQRRRIPVTPSRPRIEWLEDRLTPSDLLLSAADVRSVAAEAVTRWKEAGASQSQLQVLQNLNYQVADLGEDNLGSFRPGYITIDDDAASNLWFVDATPNRDEEFSASVGTTDTLVAGPGSVAYGTIDLLTVLLHEQGHALGLVDQFGQSNNVMIDSLQAGVRRLPFSGQADHAIPGSITNIEYLTTNPTGSSQPFDNRQPFTVLNYAIALQGIFPSRNLSITPYLGSVDMFAGNFAPKGYALAQGQLLSINQNQALFSILGTTYGGNGTTTFALPDLRGRVPIGAGLGPDGHNYVLGEQSGAESVTLGVDNLAPHTHTVPNSVTNSSSPTSVTGGGQPFENRQPTLALTPLITLEGVYPSRNLSTEDLLGSVTWFAGNFAPRGTAMANGQLLSINQNTELFSILGTTYGGNGATNFALPNLMGRMAIGAGASPGLETVDLGEQGGTSSVTPTVGILPAHAHTIPGFPDPTGTTGGSQPFDNRQAFLGLNFDLSVVGVFPAQNLQTGDATGDSVVNSGVGQGFVSGNQVLDDATAMQLIETFVQQGIRYWQAAGIDDAQVAKLESAQVELADLDPGNLAFTGDDEITIDRDASNQGWFIDATPGDNVEFGSTDPRTGELMANDVNAMGHYDLLTTIMHEQGHVLGLDHTPVPGHIMYGGLDVGGRILPTASDLVQSAPADSGIHFLESQPDIASVGMFAGNFAPLNWAATDGSLLPIAGNEQLFQLIGTTYGGDGQATFALPDLRGRAVLGTGQGTGLSNYVIGQTGGHDFVTLSVSQIPSHTHEILFVPTANDQSVSVDHNTAIAITLTGSDSNNPVQALTFAIGASPSFGTLSGFNASTGSVTYTPLNGYAGSDSFTFTVTNTSSLVSTAATVSLTVAAAAPTAAAQSVNVSHNAPQSITLTGSDPNIPTQALTFAIASSPSKGTLSGFNASTGAVTYTPSAGYAGADSFTFTVTNTSGLTSTSAIVSLTVAAAVPTANDQSVNVGHDAPMGITLTGSDPDNETLVFAIVSGQGPTHGALSGFNASTGAVTYQPDNSFAGSDSFQFTVTNTSNQTSTAATVTLAVAAAAPIADAQSVSVSHDTATGIILTGSDPNAPTQALAFAIAANPGHGVLSGFNASTGAVTYTPITGYAGADSFTFTVSNTSGLLSSAATVSLTVAAGAPTHFSVSVPSTATAGIAFSFTVTALDAFNNTATGYTGTVHFTSSDGQSMLPADATLNDGVGSFSATLDTPGSQSVTATDTTTSSITGTSNTITASAASATHFAVSAQSSAIAGSAFNFTVTALDQFNNTSADYTGTVHFTSTDGQAVLPADLTLTNGSGTFSAMLKTAGSRMVTVTDTTTSSIAGISSAIAVSAAPATHFSVSAPASATSGTAFNITVTALDAFNNTATGYIGAVHFTSSDNQATLPADSTLADGVGDFSVTLKAAGSQTVTAQDSTTSSITGTNSGVIVNAPPLFTSVATAGFTVEAAGTFAVTTSGFPGSSITESGALPDGVKFVGNGNGTATLSGTPTAFGAFHITFTARNGIGTDAAQTFTLMVNGIPPYATTSNQRFIAQAFLDLLNRFVELPALTFWAAPLDQGVARSVVVLAIEQNGSNEYQTDVVQSLYQHYLHRPAEPAALQSGVAFLNGGGADESLAAILAGSPEYFRNRGNNSVNTVLNTLYQDTLMRPIDPAALIVDQAALATNTMSAAQLALIVLNSSEYHSVFVNSTYQTFLHRPADPEGQSHFSKLMQSGLTDEQLIAALVGSPEYQQTRVGN
jgi:microcystin-dependent protein